MRALVVVTALALAGCSLINSDAPGPDPVESVRPNPPTRPAVLQGIVQAAKEEGLTGALEISDLRASDFGPGRWMICLRGERAIAVVHGLVAQNVGRALYERLHRTAPSYSASWMWSGDPRGSRLSHRPIADLARLTAVLARLVFTRSCISSPPISNRTSKMPAISLC
jgi:hypothetical protein